LLVGLGELDLDAVDTVYAVDKEDQDEYKGNLHPILEFCYYWTFAYEGKHLPAERKWEGDDKKHEERHFCHEQEEDKTVIERHLDGLNGFALWQKV
jgi:hypothetical protein